ncbi:MAG TPA: scavenger receptor cysteine-rich domain-containing protein [Myxococcota bacterium]
MTRVLPLALLLAVTTGCDFSDLFGGPVDDTPSRPSRDRDDDPAEGEGEGEPGEGEGEGEGEGPLTPEDQGHPLGPSILSFTSSTSTLDDSSSATLTIVVSDPDGVADIVGALLVDPATNTILRPLSPSGTAGTFTADVRWSDLGSASLTLDFGATARRSIRVRFIDAGDHAVSQSLPFTLGCGARSACEGRCGSFNCNAEGGCIDVGDDILDDDDQCSFCNVGCGSCNDGCACFAEADTCSGSAACLGNFAVNGGSEIVVTGSTCEVLETVRLRSDGIVVWRIGGVDRAVTLEAGVAGQTFDSDDLHALLCANAGGVSATAAIAAPSDLQNRGPVIALATPCTPTTLAQVNGCNPLIGDDDFVGTSQAIQLTCVGADPEDPEDPTDPTDPTGPDEDGDLRLVGTASSGRLEVFFNDAWGTICDDSFDNVDATVACRQLGFSSGTAVLSAGLGAGAETQSIWLDDLLCSGTEARLELCTNPGVGVHNCSHGEDVGVTCTP